MNEDQSSAIAIKEPTAMMLIQQGIASGISVEMLERLIALKNSEEDRHAKREFFRALAAFRENVPPIVKSKLVEFETKAGGKTRYYHAELDKIADVLETEMKKYQLSFRWSTAPEANGWTKTTCIITHSLGHSESATLAGPSDQSGGKNPLQAIGSSNSYLQRYTLLLVLGLVARGMDDDGRAGTEPAKDEEIDSEMADSIFKALEETGADFDRFRDYFKVQDLGELKTSQIDSVWRMINAKRKVKG